MAIQASKEFPGLGFDYDPASALYFKVIVKENLRKLNQLDTGKALLKAIAKSRPGSHGHCPRLHDQDVIDAIERAVATEAVKIPLHVGERRKLLRNLPPLTAGHQHLEDDHLNPSQRHRSGLASMLRRGHERFDQAPFGIGEVVCVAQSSPAISLPGEFSPGQCESVCCCKPIESQPTEIGQLSFTVRL